MVILGRDLAIKGSATIVTTGSTFAACTPFAATLTTINRFWICAGTNFIAMGDMGADGGGSN
jgi:hypothetical protein